MRKLLIMALCLVFGLETKDLHQDLLQGSDWYHHAV